MRFLHYVLACGLTALMLFNSVPVVRACGPIEMSPIFVLKKSPDPPFDGFTSGKIGIVRPTFGRKTMVIAYHYLNGGSFTSEEQKELIAALKATAPEEDGTDALKAWIVGRNEFFKDDQKLPEIYTEREHGGYDFFPNCTKNAFEVALETLKDRAATYGAEDPNVKAWLAAQDTVFQNCSRGAQIPDELGAESPTWLRKDREYQIAAAYFYALNFDEARARFKKIAADLDSPWREVADYLVARTLIRQGSLGGDQNKKRELYEQAEDHLKRLVLTGGKFASGSGKLLALVKYHLHPEERVVELSRILTAGNHQNLRQDLIDYVWLLDKFEAQVIKAEEERKKKLAGTQEVETPYSDNRPEDVKQLFERIQRGELIELTIYPVKSADGNPDYSQRVMLAFKHDASEAEILGAFEQQIGRKLSTEEFLQLKNLHQSALSHRQWLMSPNRKWDRATVSEYEGCSPFECTGLTLDLIPDFLRSDELSEWILTLQTKDPRAYRHALSKWRKTDSPAWLLTSLVKAEKTSPRLNELMRAGEKITRDDPAYPTVVYHLIRLKADLGNKIEARRLLDEIISWQPGVLPVSAQNQFLELRLQLARGLNEFLKSAQRKPVFFYEDGRLGKLSDLLEMTKQYWNPRYDKPKEEYDRDLDEMYKDLLPWDDRFSFDEKTTDIFNWHFPTQLLAEAARNPNLPDYLKRSFVLAAWTRATLLHNDEVALGIAPEVLKVEPKLTSVFEPYLKARTIKERRNAALYVLLKFPDLSPFVQGGIPTFTTSEELDYYFQDSWWCELGKVDYDEQFNEIPKVVPKPGFLTPAQLEAARREHLALAALGEGKSYLGKQVIAWAKASPSDPRIPEALFIASKANESYKYGCQGWESDETSKTELESILRRRYPLNPWTAKLAPPEN